MYKNACKFLHRHSKGGRLCRFNTKLVSSTDLHTYRPHPHTHAPALNPQYRNWQRVYLVLFTNLANPSIQFLKIGVSSMPTLLARFSKDLHSYKIEALASSPRYPVQDALALEKAIHAAFRSDSCRPSIRLSSGNTECYVYSEANARKFVALINRL
jgi:hypothetical protein